MSNDEVATLLQSFTFPEIMTIRASIPVYFVARDLLPMINALKKNKWFDSCANEIEKYLDRYRLEQLWELSRNLQVIIQRWQTEDTIQCANHLLDVELVLELFYASTLGTQSVEPKINFLERRVFIVWILWLSLYKSAGKKVISKIEEIPEWIQSLGMSLHTRIIKISKPTDHFKEMLEFILSK